MKRYRTLPTSQDFFDRYAYLINQLRRTSYLSQFVSAITEIGVIFTLIYNAVAELLPELALPFAIIGAVIGTALLEIGLRVLLPYSARVFLHRRFKGLDLLMSIVILIATAALLLSSGTLSFKGSQDAVEAVAPPPVQKTTTAADSSATAAQVQAQNYFAADSLLIAQRYAAQLDATQQAYAAKITKAQAVFDKYEKREQATGKSYTTAKANARIKAADLEAELRSKLADLRAAEAAELATVQQERKERLQATEQAHSDKLLQIETDNQKAEDEATATATKWGLGVGWFTVICLVYLVLVIILDEAHAKGSGISEKAEPSQYNFDPSVLAELFAAWGERFNYWTRSRIRAYTDKTPAAPLPATIKSLYDRTDIGLPVIELKADPQTAQQVIYLPQAIGPTSSAADPQQAIEYLSAAEALEAQNKTAEAQRFILKAEDVLRLYLGPQATQDGIEQLKTQCVEHIHGKAENPFSHHHRRPIGYTTNATVTNATVKDGNKRCVNCQQEYKPKVSWQKFCGKQCKEAHHAAKHNGQKFDPSVYRRK
jgi:hypothetical protein